MSGLSIKEVELRISEDLQPSLKSAFQQAGYSVPDHSRLRVSLVDSSGRKKRSNAKADNWSPDSGWLQVWFEPIDADACDIQPENPTGATASTTSGERSAAMNTNPALGLIAVVRALAHAESIPGWSFVSLKKFRDEILPKEASELSAIDQRHFLGHAINEKLITTSKVANPKDPRFPVTTIRLNRLNDVVQKILGEPSRKNVGFSPIHIKGEPVSATILRERR